MKEPILVVMAAGMGSRYGGAKQIDPVGDNGEIIIDFSIFDAVKAGFKKVIFIVKEEILQDVKDIIGDKVSNFAEVKYVIQSLDKLPDGFSIPEERVKPWGTGHAILCCMDDIDAPFAVINADDYYGQGAYKTIYNYLTSIQDTDKADFAMVGYYIKNTVTDNGSVARGVCKVNDEGYLTEIVERTQIEKKGDKIAFTEDKGETWEEVSPDNIVSMNFWGFTEVILKELKEKFPEFLEKTLKTNPLKGEYLLPTIVGEMLEEGRATVKVLPSTDVWYGVTYKEDKPGVVNAIKKFKEAGVYPADLWAK